MRDKITEVQIIPIKPSNGLVGFASFVLNESWYLGSIGIFTRPEGGYRLTYPTKNIADKSIQVFHPINKAMGQYIEEVVINKFEEVTNNYVGHSSHRDE